MSVRQYATPLAFKQALEQRLKSSSATGMDFGRRRQLLVFDRFLARLTQVAGDAVTLKGGLVLELRLERERTTKDIDVRMMGSPRDVLERLQEAGRLDLGDSMRFEIQPDEEHPEIQSEGMQYEGYRYRAECRLAGMIYGRPFGVDVAFGDPLIGEPDIVTAEDTLGFAGIAPPAIRLYPVVSHIAEKLHALTMPRRRPNSRVRDLPDIALLATTGSIDGSMLRRAIETTFEFRDTRLPNLGSWGRHCGATGERPRRARKSTPAAAASPRGGLNPSLRHLLFAPEIHQQLPRICCYSIHSASSSSPTSALSIFAEVCLSSRCGRRSLC